VIMAFCDGGDLTAFLKHKKDVKMSEGEVLYHFVQLCLALEYMHFKSILHRDLKTQNVFIQNGMLKLGDFGISKVLDGTHAFASTCIGTPYYMSPELFKNKPYNFKSDIWALGCVLYELTSLKHAFDAGSLNGLAGKIIKGAYPPLPAKYSRGLRDLVKAMLSLNPTLRPDFKTIFHKPFVQKTLKKFVTWVLRHPEYFQPRDCDNLRAQIKRIGFQSLLDEFDEQQQRGHEQAAERSAWRKAHEEKLKKLQEEEDMRLMLENNLKKLKDEHAARKLAVQAKKEQRIMYVGGGGGSFLLEHLVFVTFSRLPSSACHGCR